MKKYFIFVVLFVVVFLSACSLQQKTETNIKIQNNLEKTTEGSGLLQIEQRVPEGTQESSIIEDKIVNYPLNEVAVIFNKDIDQNSLNENNFYALWGIEEKIPATISYNKEERKASLKFDQPIVSVGDVTRVTVVLNNIKSNNQSIDKYSYNIDIKN